MHTEPVSARSLEAADHPISCALLGTRAIWTAVFEPSANHCQMTQKSLSRLLRRIWICALHVHGPATGASTPYPHTTGWRCVGPRPANPCRKAALYDTCPSCYDGADASRLRGCLGGSCPGFRDNFHSELLVDPHQHGARLPGVGRCVAAARPRAWRPSLSIYPTATCKPVHSPTLLTLTLTLNPPSPSQATGGGMTGGGANGGGSAAALVRLSRVPHAHPLTLAHFTTVARQADGGATGTRWHDGRWCGQRRPS